MSSTGGCRDCSTMPGCNTSNSSLTNPADFSCSPGGTSSQTKSSKRSLGVLQVTTWREELTTIITITGDAIPDCLNAKASQDTITTRIYSWSVLRVNAIFRCANNVLNLCLESGQKQRLRVDNVGAQEWMEILKLIELKTIIVL